MRCSSASAPCAWPSERTGQRSSWLRDKLGDNFFRQTRTSPSSFINGLVSFVKFALPCSLFPVQLGEFLQVSSSFGCLTRRWMRRECYADVVSAVATLSFLSTPYGGQKMTVVLSFKPSICRSSRWISGGNLANVLEEPVHVCTNSGVFFFPRCELQCIRLFFSQILFDFKRLVSHSISPKFSGNIPYVLSKPRICFLGSKDKTVLLTTRKANWGKMAPGVFPENFRKIERETNVL